MEHKKFISARAGLVGQGEKVLLGAASSTKRKHIEDDEIAVAQPVATT
jgi:hypothetical protein